MSYVVLARADWREAVEFSMRHAGHTFKEWSNAQSGRLVAMGYGNKKNTGFEMSNDPKKVLWLHPRSSEDGLPWLMGPIKDRSLRGQIKEAAGLALAGIYESISGQLIRGGKIREQIVADRDDAE